MFVLNYFKVLKLTVLKLYCKFMYHAVLIKVKRAPPLLKQPRVLVKRGRRGLAQGGAPGTPPPVYPGAVAKLGKRGLARRWGTLKG